MNQQISSLVTPPRATEAAPTVRASEQTNAERARYNRGQVITTYWYLLYMLSLGLFAAVVVILGAELW